MANEYVHNTGDTIHEGDSYLIKFRFVDAEDGSAVAPSSQKVYITEQDSGDTVNDRDGSDATGLGVTDTNLVTFTASPADAEMATTQASEIHRVRIELKYNADADVDNRVFLVRVDKST